MKVSYRSVFTFMLSFIFFFPPIYTNHYTLFIRYILVGAAGLGLFAKRKRLRYKGVSTVVKIGCSYFIYVFIISAYRGLAYANIRNVVSIVAFAVYVMYIDLFYKRNELECINTLFAVFLIFMLWDLVGIIMYPNGLTDTKSVYGAQFLFGNKNNHTMQVLIFMLLAIWRKIKSNDTYKRSIYVSVVIAVAITFLLGSSTSIVSVLIALTGILLYLLKFWEVSISAMIVLIIGFVLNLLIITGSAMFLTNIVNLFEKNMTFSKRSGIWDSTIPYILKKPLLGWGYMDSNSSIQLLGTINTHNQLLDCLFIGGIVLLLIFVFALFTICKAMDCINNNHIKMLMIFFFAALLIKMMFEQVATSNVAWLFLVLLYDFSKSQQRE